MKIITAILAAFGLFAAACHAQLAVPVSAKNIKIAKIAPQVVGTPEFQVSGVPPKRMEPAKWFEIEVEFDIKDIELVDELTFEYTALVNNKLCTGQVTHVNITKGNGRFSVMYIGPKSLDKITGGKPLNAGMIDTIWIRVLKQGQLLAQDATKQKPVPNLPRLEGMLVPKSETPFQVLWWDRYEAVKTVR